MIKFKNVTKGYGTFHAVHAINLEIRAGEIVALIGPSGSGKTTTLKMINRLIDPCEGEIFVNEKNIQKENAVELRRHIGYVIQHVGLLPHMTIADNVALVPRLNKWDKKAIECRVDELMSMVGLDPNVFRNRYPAELSGGQQQRIGVIRALAADPPVVLMDEPFSALDPISREQLQDELLRLQQKLKKTIVFVTHDIDEAIKLADRMCIMKQGQVVQLDMPERILRHPVNDFVQSFIGSHRISQIETLLPTLDEVMYKPKTAKVDWGLAESISSMKNHKVDTLLIVDERERLLGVVGVWDIQNYFHEEEMTLGDIMRTKLPVIHHDQSLQEAIRLISNQGIAYLPVVNDSHELLGVITRASLVDVMAKQVSAGGVHIAC